MDTQEVVALYDIRPKRILMAKPRLISCQIFLRFFTEHSHSFGTLGSFQNDLSSEMNDLAERDLARFEFKMRFGRISYIARAPIDNGTCRMALNNGTNIPVRHNIPAERPKYAPE